MIYETINEIITTKDSGVKIFEQALERINNEEDKKLLIDKLVEGLKPEQVTLAIEKFCLVEDENEGQLWNYVYGDIDRQHYKTLLANSTLEIDESLEKNRIELSYLWEDRRDREISYILDKVMEMGFNVDYWPYIRDPENQGIYINSDLSKNRPVKGIRTKYTKDQLNSIYNFLVDSHFVEEKKEDLFIQSFSPLTLKELPKIKWIEENPSFHAFIALMKGSFLISQYARAIGENQLFIQKNGNPYQPRNLTKKVSDYDPHQMTFDGPASVIQEFFEKEGLILKKKSKK